MGYCSSIEVIEIGGDRVTVFKQDQEYLTRTSTIVLRGATMNYLDDVERSIDDAVNVVKGLIKDPRLIPGCGATEMELAKRVIEFGEKTSGLSQHAVKKFGVALEVIPRTLAENAGLDETETLSRLSKKHEEGGKDWGVDVDVSSIPFWKS
jgi:T-complex protein 1 subunit theta